MEQADLLKKVVEILDALEITYMIVGSYGSGAWGEPRFTYDIDVVVALSPSEAKKLIRAFPLPEFYISEEAVNEAIKNHGQFNVIHPTSGNKIDFMIEGQDTWGKSQLKRRRKVDLMGVLKTYVAAPEDIIISKMIYYKEGGSEKHLRDITGILKISESEVDRDYVDKWAKELGLMEIWEAILKRIG